ncbi:DegT/DnrJ/EryC1/StrS family aminotransferase [Bacteroidota bacterium]
MWKVPYINISLQHKPIKDSILKEVEQVILSGQFILGKYVEDFEKEFALLCESKFAMGVANGTDALILSMKVFGIGTGDEVITAPNSYLASASSIALTGATPVFVDVRDDFNIDPEKIRKAISSKTKAIIPVHLTGRPADMDSILEISRKHNLFVFEDAAQAVRAEYKNQRVGSFGDTGCFSLHPLKNLSAVGDGGMITTNDESVYKDLLKLRNHGLINRDECEVWSLNSRLDALQAAILKVKLPYLKENEAKRRALADIYSNRIGKYVKVPFDKENEKAVYHTYIIQLEKRDELKEYLTNHSIDSKIHYPIPIHLQKSAEYLNYRKGDFPVTEKQAQTILSLPISPELTEEQVNFVCDTIENFFTDLS